MKWTLLAALALAGCSKPAPPVASTPVPAVFVVPASDPAPAPVSVPVPVPVPEPVPVPVPVPDSGRPGRPASQICSPTFTLESLDGGPDVFLNGERVGRTPYRWWVSPQTEFAPDIPVLEWPPALTRPAARGRVLTDEGVWVTMEVRIAGGKFSDETFEVLSRRYPLVDPADHLLFVRAELPGRRVQGALRVRLPGYRFVSYVPTGVTEDSPDFQRWSRALWFERE